MRGCAWLQQPPVQPLFCDHTLPPEGHGARVVVRSLKYETDCEARAEDTNHLKREVEETWRVRPSA